MEHMTQGYQNPCGARVFVFHFNFSNLEQDFSNLPKTLSQQTKPCDKLCSKKLKQNRGTTTNCYHFYTK